MQDKFEEIMLKQEKEDNLLNAPENVLLQKLKEEFINYNELLAFLHEDLKTSAVHALKTGNVDLKGKVIPIRYVTELRVRKHTKVQMPYLHCHSFYEILFVLKGNCYQTIGIDNKPTVIKANQACLIFPNTTHRLEKIQNDEIIFKLHIPKELFEACSPIEFDHLQAYQIFSETTAQSKVYLVKLLEESHNKNQFSTVAIKSFLSLFLIELVRGKIDYNNAITERLENYFQFNYKNSSLTDFSKELGYHSAYVGRMIKKVTQKTFSQLQTEYRLKEVLKKLADTDFTIENIAYEVGYSNTTGLYKAFFKTYGMTPTEYRNSIKQ